VNKKKAKPHRKFYLVLSKKHNYTHGAFPYSEEGLKLAKSFITQKENAKEKFYIVEK
jgi:hypothetical protein